MNDLLENLFSLNDRTVLVAGASRGIGHALAEGCAAADGRVFAFARSNEYEPFATAEVTYRRCDIADKGAVSSLITEIAAKHGGIDVLINCAGISLDPDPDGNSEAFRKTIEVNLTAAYSLMQAVYPHMKAKGGSMIQVTSLASRFGMPDNPGYVAAKGGLASLCRALALDWGKDGIRVNAILPGYILTDMTRRSHEDAEKRGARQRRMILDRWGRPDDLVGAVLFLASEASAYVTGTEIVVDGGWSARGL
jgi:NAD(P)-dependent dehydrogenase (short-subunit alcohol dehydrogenase family)